MLALSGILITAMSQIRPREAFTKIVRFSDRQLNLSGQQNLIKPDIGK